MSVLQSVAIVRDLDKLYLIWSFDFKLEPIFLKALAVL
jgi:hypothetical protein